MIASKTDNPTNWDIDTLIEAIGELDDAPRKMALSVLAHHLTVEIRAALHEPFPHSGLDQVRELNEFLHQLTGRLSPDEERSAADDKSLLVAFASDAARAGLEKNLRRGLVIAVRHALATAKRPVPAL